VSLRLSGVRKLYPEFELALDFEVAKGELLTLLGPSGCGKTTTLRMVAGFISPDAGRIEIGGAQVERLPPHRRGVGIVFQDYALFPHLSVAGNVGFGPRMHGWSARRTRERVRALLRIVRLEGYERRKVATLSGGEQQRVALARALAPGPGLLLLDEPLSALDARLRHNLRAEIRRIQDELRLTTLYVTHDQEEALALSDRVAVMRAGRIEQIGPPREVYHRPRNLFVAGFVGAANLIPGRLAGLDGRRVRVRTELGVLRAPGEALPDGIAAEGAAAGGAGGTVLFVRPERCRIGRGGNRVRGRVESVEYLGGSVRLEVQAGERRLRVELPDSAAGKEGMPARGETVEIGFEVEDCWLLPGPDGPDRP
jgi:ABC-type Fe3+/spermidine/putrescine transport system ATPase subunit